MSTEAPELPPFRRDSAGGATATVVYRVDRGFELPASETTPEGFLLATVHAAKPGVLIYTREDGSQRRELVTEETLSRVDDLRTLARKSVTIEHPDEPVDTRNVGELGVGDVDGAVAYKDGYVTVTICLRREDGIAAVRRGKQEVSPGYAVGLDETPGEHPTFGRYDAKQIWRKYNHLALTDAARGGPDIRLRADGSTVVRLREDRSSDMNPKLIALLVSLGVKVRKDAEDQMLDEGCKQADEMSAKVGELATHATHLAALKAKCEQLEAELLKCKKELAAAQPAEPGAMVDAAMEADPCAPAEGAEPKPEEKKADSIRKAVARQVTERGRLESLALGLGLEPASMSKLGNKSLRKAIVAKANPHARTDAADDYYRAAIDMLPQPGQRRDAADPTDPYAGLTQEFRRNTDEGRGRRGDAHTSDEPDVDHAWADTVGTAFRARHGIQSSAK